MEMNQACSCGFELALTIEDDIKETINWILENCNKSENRYNVFTDKDYAPS